MYALGRGVTLGPTVTEVDEGLAVELEGEDVDEGRDVLFFM